VVAIHDLDIVPPTADAVSCTYPVVCSVSIDSSFRHRGSVETIQWYQFDTGMFVSSGTDKLVKVWDTNLMRVSRYLQSDVYFFSAAFFLGLSLLMSCALLMIIFSDLTDHVSSQCDGHGIQRDY